MKTQRLMRVVYRTDINDTDPEYIGAFSEPFPEETPTQRIVNVDWSVRGQVEVTWLTEAGR